MNNLIKKPKIIKVQSVAQSRLFTIEAVELTFPNGVRRIYERMKSFKRESVMIVAILDDTDILLIQEYAVALENYVLSFPKGLIESGEDTYEAANRELKEEVGFGSKKIQTLGQLTMAPSYFSSEMHILIAEELYREKLEGDEPEPLIIQKWPLDNLLSLLDEPNFRDARNVSALFMVREWLVKQGRLTY
ncbi:ADP compounds hydrolase NudE [Pantoea sp. Mhis]|uniref:ADP compounds hydrolase NudE n=1 Tax=Pantoea sp. Mhis TaxID=2576759 RepID=UPI00135A3C33|nr:ADP compounds hydrolase NudE [Pantoea sp. Mhis]MXP56531.1 ADP compounds hydrolase NudE [Pantoea sp. Mhis]